MEALLYAMRAQEMTPEAICQNMQNQGKLKPAILSVTDCCFGEVVSLSNTRMSSRKVGNTQWRVYLGYLLFPACMITHDLSRRRVGFLQSFEELSGMLVCVTFAKCPHPGIAHRSRISPGRTSRVG